MVKKGRLKVVSDSKSEVVRMTFKIDPADALSAFERIYEQPGGSVLMKLVYVYVSTHAPGANIEQLEVDQGRSLAHYLISFDKSGCVNKTR